MQWGVVGCRKLRQLRQKLRLTTQRMLQGVMCPAPPARAWTVADHLFE